MIYIFLKFLYTLLLARLSTERPRNNVIMKSSLNYVTPWTTQCHTLELKKYQSFLNYALANFQNSMWFVFYCTFNFSYCELLIVYFISCVLLYPRPIAHFYMYICRILLIQLLGCHIEINACLKKPLNWFRANLLTMRNLAKLSSAAHV